VRTYQEILDHYTGANEQERLTSAEGLLEFLRTRSVLERLLPPPPAVVYDIGGGAGVYSLWLASLGYQTHLIDLVPKHIDQARAASNRTGRGIVSCTVGDARKLDVESGQLAGIRKIY
jgi:2-polyprenyl-3-methyl-5-hydroxy-6-metoxy-1,4-benzoquinol methylase